MLGGQSQIKVLRIIPLNQEGILGVILTMGRIVANISICNFLEPDRKIECDALVDTGAAYMVLPKAWQNRLGKLNVIREIDCETTTGDLV